MQINMAEGLGALLCAESAKKNIVMEGVVGCEVCSWREPTKQ
jgi:hypothetical protein